MKHGTVFITGATGYIGQRAVKAFIARGWGVKALTRREAPELPREVDAVRGDFVEVDAWGPTAREADAVVHLAFPAHGDGWAAAAAVERKGVDALADHLRGGKTRLILANGTAFLGDSGGGRLGPEAPVDVEHPAASRAATSSPARFVDLDVLELRFASFVYGRGGSVFLPKLMQHARDHRESIYVDDGDARTSTVEVDAAARACVAAVERGRPGATYHIAGDEEPALIDIARAVPQGAGPGTALRSVSPAEAAERLDPFTALFLVQGNRLDSHRARGDLRWTGATRTSMLWDVAFGSYATG